MLTPARHLVEQRQMLRSLGNVAVDSVIERLRPPRRTSLTLPGPELVMQVAPPSSALIEAFLDHVGSDPAAEATRVPPHLFPQWGLAAALRALRGCGFPLAQMLNGGCRLQSNASLRRDQSLTVRARLESVSESDRHSVLCQRVVTEQPGAAEALVAEVYGIVRRPGAARSSAKSATALPPGAQKLDEWALGRDAGLSFALLTGDLNPLHWLRPYARAMGFRSTILHGFAAMARTHAALERRLAPRRLRLLDVRFRKPMLLPARLSLYVAGDQVLLSAADEAVCLTGRFELELKP
jgi:acyl dehydratase